ncbi:hypothetical protein RclHR1_10590007 [Rhizophagus clarus]|uniref:Uncharacterized protein n=1 Tax=Rhizophagus clarus TaxID=94130 RepID=A0A2Z6Q340_9GLOM|nr:hypothetical protein RclHR1_10590007 [Rhizophagus clarus]GES73132.1 hypothetical protein RCL_jg2181.t1 [Rhizophagus clarus]
MTRIERHIGLQPLPSTPTSQQNLDMLIDPPDNSNLSVAPDAPHHDNSFMHSLTPLLPDFVPTRPIQAPIHTQSSPVIASNVSSSSHIPATIPSLHNTIDEIQAINKKHSAIESKMDMLVASISSFISSINTSSFSNSAAPAGSN